MTPHPFAVAEVEGERVPVTIGRIIGDKAVCIWRGERGYVLGERPLAELRERPHPVKARPNPEVAQ